MATRGTAIIIDEKFVSMGPEFNGDMYPHGYGDEFMELLSEVNDSVDFIKFNNSFNKYNFNYSDIMECYQGKLKHEDILNDEVYSMEKIYKNVISDWVFVKNLTNKPIKVEVFDRNENAKIIEVKENETFRVHFGIFKEDGNIHKI